MTPDIEAICARLEELMSKATRGPLSYDGCSLSDFDSECHMTMEWIPNACSDDDDLNARAHCDGALLAECRNAMPDILAALAEQKARIAGLENDRDDCVSLAESFARTAGDLLARALAAEQRADRAVELLRPFVRSCEWIEAGDYPVHIGNDINASAYDLTPEDVASARAFLEQDGAK